MIKRLNRQAVFLIIAADYWVKIRQEALGDNTVSKDNRVFREDIYGKLKENNVACNKKSHNPTKRCAVHL